MTGITKTERILRSLKEQYKPESKQEIGTDMYLPNLSGDHSAGIVRATPADNLDIANKKYVDDNDFWTQSGGLLIPETATNTLKVGDGTVAAPSYAFSSEPDCGLYYVAANTIGFSSGGTAKFYMTNSAIMGISNGLFSIACTSNTAGLPPYSFRNDEDTGMYSDTADTLQFTAGGIKRMEISTAVTFIGPSDGTGINVYSSSAANDPDIELARNFGAADIFNIRVRGAAGAAYLSIWDTTNGTVDKGIVLKANAVGIGCVPTAAFNVEGSAVFNEAGADADFRIEGDTNANLFKLDAGLGKIGIGLATPDYLLTLYQASLTVGDPILGIVSGDLGSNEGAAIAFGNRLAAGGNRYFARIYGYSSAVDLGGALWFDTSAVDTPTYVNRLIIGSTGNVVWNETGADADFRIEGDTQANLLALDAGVEQIGIGTATFDATGRVVLSIANGTAPSAHVDNQIQIYSADTADATSTLALMLEQAVEAIGTFTPSHKIKVLINGTAYWIQLDAV